MTDMDERFERTEWMITTKDNPYDYFTQFKEWIAFDNEKGYNTCGILARIIVQLGDITDDMTQREEDDLVSKAIDIMFTDLYSDNYKRISRTVAG